eukprot:1180969-Prorocentrum_minimum.AAC.2
MTPCGDSLFSVAGMLASTFVVCYPPFNWLSKDHPCMPADFGHVAQALRRTVFERMLQGSKVGP